MSWSSTASRNGRVLVRLAILSTDRMATLSSSLNASVPTRNPVVSQILLSRISRQLSESLLSKHLACVSRTYSQLQPTNLTYFSLLISRQVVGALTCPNTSLVSPGPAPNLSLSRYSRCSSPGELSELSLVQTPHLCLQDLLPTSACRDTPSISKTCRFRQSIDKSPSTNDLTANMPKRSETKHTSPESRILKLFDAL